MTTIILCHGLGDACYTIHDNAQEGGQSHVKVARCECSPSTIDDLDRRGKRDEVFEKALMVSGL